MILLPCCIALGSLALSAQAPGSWRRVAVDDGGTEHTPHLLQGKAYIFSEELVAGDESARSCSFGDPVVFGYRGLDPEAKYALHLKLASDGDRTQQLEVNGIPVGEPLVLVAGDVLDRTFELPAKCLEGEHLLVSMQRLAGPNAVVSWIEVLSTSPKELPALEPGSWRPGEFPVTPPTPEELERLLPTYRPLPESTVQAGRPIESLSGEWRVNPKPTGEWWKDPGTLEDWPLFVVPGQLVQQGHEFSPESPVAFLRTFELDPAWLGGRVIVRFESVFSFARVFVNGRFVGEHLGGFTPFEFDITDALTPERNSIAVEVTSASDADLLGSLSQYTNHPLGGILREVSLFTVPLVHLTDLRIVTRFDEEYENAVLELDLELTNTSDEEVSDLSLGIRVYDTEIDEEPDLDPLPPRSTRRHHYSFEVLAPRKWDPEHPTLHYLQLFLNHEGAETENVIEAFGFRQVEVRGNRLLVNGVPVKLRGVNRHVVHPRRGRVVEFGDCVEDGSLFREANCNYVRTSHYPPSRDFLKVCDQLGMFVEVEAPLCWIGHGANPNWSKLDYRDPRWRDYLLQANLEMVHFYRNHPSVILWSLANESSWSRNFAEVLAAVELADPTRPQVFHDQAWGGFNNRGSTAPVANLHYPGPGGPKHVADGEFARPVLFGEYCHLSVYNRREALTDPGVREAWGVALKNMWEEILRTDGVLGGALWSGIDDVFLLPDGSATGYGPWGLVDGWRRRKPEFWQVRKAYSPIRVISHRLGLAGFVTVELENRFLFTHLDEVMVEWWRGEESGAVLLPEVAPGERGNLEIDTGAEGPLQLAFQDPRRFVCEEVVIGNLPPAPPPPPPPRAPSPAPEISVESGRLRVTAGAYRLEFDQETGLITSLTRDGAALLAGGPHLFAAPLTTEPCRPEHDPNLAPETEVCSGWRLEELKAGPADAAVSIRIAGANDVASGVFTLHFEASGSLGIEYDFVLASDSLTPRQLGVVFELPSDFNALGWERDAPWTYYPQYDIGRARGWAPVFYDEIPRDGFPTSNPDWLWSADANELGCNDFRATRRNLWWLELKTEDRRRVRLLGDGTGHARCWVGDDGRIQLLAASRSVPTGEPFVRSHFAGQVQTLEKGSKLSGSLVLVFP